MTGTYCYVGVTQRPFNWDYTTDIQTARLTALRLGLASGAAFDERNDMPAIITNGYNWVAPYPGRYRLRAMSRARWLRRGKYRQDALRRAASLSRPESAAR
jgi:hypothetical protein